MNEKIDVLAVIRHHCAGLEAASGCGGLTFNANQAGHVAGDLRRVEAAIAELIEAAKPLASAARDRGLMEDILKGMRPHEAVTMRESILALDAALASVGGGK